MFSHTGNDVLHSLAASAKCTLRIDMVDMVGNKTYAQYRDFSVGSEADGYKLKIGSYSGTGKYVYNNLIRNTRVGGNS